MVMPDAKSDYREMMMLPIQCGRSAGIEALQGPILPGPRNERANGVRTPPRDATARGRRSGAKETGDQSNGCKKEARKRVAGKR